MKIYIAAPLFNEMEFKRNLEMQAFLKAAGFETYLPQENSGVYQDLVRSGHSLVDAKRELFERDVRGIDACDLFLCMLDGRVPDEGACVELGIAWAKRKICIGYKTDIRKFGDQGENIMIEGSLLEVVSTKEQLLLTIRKYKE